MTQKQELKEISKSINAATLREAMEWGQTDEKYTHCIDTLGISAWDSFADRVVERLERKYERILAAAEKQARLYMDRTPLGL